MHHKSQYPHYAEQNAEDVRDWAIALEVAEHRQGQMPIFALGGAARRFSDGMVTREKQYGVELHDAQGSRRVRTGIRCRVHLESLRVPAPGAPGGPHVAHRFGIVLVHAAQGRPS